MTTTAAIPLRGRPPGPIGPLPRRIGLALIGERAPFFTVMLLLAVAAAFGGSSLRTAPGWSVLFGVGGLACGYALWRLSLPQVAPFRTPLLLGSACLLLPALQLVPLPPAVWQALPGRGLVVAIDQAEGLAGLWRPLSLVPSLTEHALLGLLLPMAVLLMAVQMKRNCHERLLRLLVALVLASATLAMMQWQKPELVAMLGYRSGYQFGATGLFSNRNHQALALACALPLVLALLARLAHKRAFANPLVLPGLTLASIVLIFVLVLVTGSRAGLLLFAMAALSLPLLWPVPTTSAEVRRLALLGGIAVLALAAAATVALETGQARALSRLLRTDAVAELRPVIAAQTLAVASDYWPAGSGMGSFVAVYALHEPDALLQPALINQAHNEYLDLFLTGGLPGLLLLAAAVWAVARAAWQLRQAGWRQRYHVRLQVCGITMLLLCAAASLLDYPLRTPLMMSLAAIALVWAHLPINPDLLAEQAQRRSRRTGTASSQRHA